MGQGSAAGTDGVDINLGLLHGQATHHRCRSNLGDPILDQGHIRAGSPHVEAEQVGVATQATQIGRPINPACRPREQSQRSMGRRLSNGGHPAGRLHDQGLGDPSLPTSLGQAVQVARQCRAEVGIDGGGAEALVFAELRRHLARQGKVQIGKSLPQGRPQPLFVLRVEKRKQKPHPNSADPIPLHPFPHLLHHPPDFGIGERL